MSTYNSTTIAGLDTTTPLEGAGNSFIPELNDAVREIKTCIKGDVTGSGKLVMQNQPTINWSADGPVLTNLLTNSQWMACSGSTLENVGSNLGQNFANTAVYPFETFTISGLAITSAINSSGFGYCNAAVTCVVGKLYRLQFTPTVTSGTAPQVYVSEAIDTSGTRAIIPFQVTTGVAVDVTFEATATTQYISIGVGTGVATNFSTTAYTLYEVTPGYVAADTLAPDTMTKTSTLDIHQYWNAGSANTYGYGKYLLKLTKGAATAEYLNFGTAINYRDCQGKPVTLGCYVYSVTATDNIKLSIHDGLTEVGLSSTFVGANAITWVELTATLAAGATALTPRILCDGTAADVAYISHPMLVRGTSIGAGNYQPIPNEVIYLQAVTTSTNFSGTQGLSSGQVINLESDSAGRIGKGVRSVMIRLKSHNNTVGKWLSCYQATTNAQYGVTLGSYVSDVGMYANGIVPCDSNGDIYINADDVNFHNIEIIYQAIQT